MKYMMFVCTDTEPDPPTGDPRLDDVEDWVDRHDACGPGDGERAAADGRGEDRALRDGKLLVTDGPFAETREWIAGFDILECADLDEAIASRRASDGAVRPPRPASVRPPTRGDA